MSEILKSVNGDELIVKKPTLRTMREGKKVYNRAFNDALQSKAPVRARLDDLLREQGLWNDEKQIKYDTIKKEMLDLEVALAKGGVRLVDAKNMAMQMIKLRSEMRDLISERTRLDNHTAEGQAENAQFDYFVSACLVYKNNEDKPFFADLEDYLNSSDPVAFKAATNLSSMIYGLDPDYESKLPEYKFLRKFGFVDEKLRFINKDKKLVDVDGRLINESGRLVNENGELVDFNGRRVDEEGNYIFDEQPFLDDDGKEIVIVEEGGTSMLADGITRTAIFSGSDNNPNGEQIDAQGAEVVEK